MISSHRVFDDYAGDYDRWFDEHGTVYEAQVRILKNAVPRPGCGLEVGVGSGRFAGPLGIGSGIDPSREPLMMAKSRGVEVVLGEGEHLPYRPKSFDYVLMMTMICFVEKPLPLFREAYRALSFRGELIVAFIERDGEIARQYLQEKTKGRFLRYARFPSVEEVIGLFGSSGFSGTSVIQKTGGFCVIKGLKQ